MYDDSGSCFVCKQPATHEEVSRMINAVHASEMKCIRYAGTEPDTLRGLVAVGERDRCDALPQEQEQERSKHAKKVWWALWRR